MRSCERRRATIPTNGHREQRLYRPPLGVSGKPAQRSRGYGRTAHTFDAIALATALLSLLPAE